MSAPAPLAARHVMVRDSAGTHVRPTGFGVDLLLPDGTSLSVSWHVLSRAYWMAETYRRRLTREGRAMPMDSAGSLLESVVMAGDEEGAAALAKEHEAGLPVSAILRRRAERWSALVTVLVACGIVLGLALFGYAWLYEALR